jgi:DNA-directed RNA polymerase specialized sigma24 family protein
MTHVIFIAPPDCTEKQYTEMFEFIYDEYAGSIYGMVLKAVNGEADIAQSITAQTFITIYRELHSYRQNKSRLFTWIYIILKKQLAEKGYSLSRPAINHSK